MIGRDHQGGLVLVLRVRLQPVPQLAQLTIRPRVGVEQQVVLPVVSPIVGLVERQVQQPRALFLQVVHGEAEGEGVVTNQLPRCARLALQFVQLANRWIISSHRLFASVDRDRAGHVFDNAGEDGPRRERGNLALR